MAPEILIVGDASQRRGLIREVRDAGYEVTLCRPEELDRRVRAGPAPATILICVADADAASLLGSLRRTRPGAAIPVILFGRPGGEIRDLSDVLDLGADHFVRDPHEPDELRDALVELAGAPGAVDGGPSEVSAAPGGPGWAMSTERIDAPVAGGSAEAGPHRDPVLGELHRTLDRLEARLRARGEGEARDEGRSLSRGSARGRVPVGGGEPTGADTVDLDDLGLDRIPGLDPEEGTLDPAELDRPARDRRSRGDAEGEGFDTGDDPGSERGEDRGEGRGEDRRDDQVGREGDRGTQRELEPGGTPRTRTESTVRLDAPPAERSGVLAPRRPPRRAAPSPESAAVPGGLPRTGSLARSDVPELIWRLHRAGATGRLTLRRARVEKQLCFEGGELRFARSGSSADRFVDSLLRRGVLTRAQYETARRLAAREPRRAGSLLIEAGLIKAGELETLLADHLCHMIQSTFPWTEGSWDFEPGAELDEPITLDVPVGQVLLEGIRQRVETSRLRLQVFGGAAGGDMVAPRLVGGAEACDRLARAYDLIDDERDWLACLDGETPLRVLLDAPDADEHGLLALVRALVVTGELELEGTLEDPVARDPAEIDRARVLERLRIAREQDYFELLGLPRDATGTEVRRAHTQMSATFADHALEPESLTRLEPELLELRAALLEARDILMDDSLRRAYLAHLDDTPSED